MGFVSSAKAGTIWGYEVDGCFSEFRVGQSQVYFLILSLLLVFLAESWLFSKLICEGV